MSEKVVVVTGANGDIGKPLVTALLEMGYQVAACVRDASQVSFANDENLKFFNCDFSCADSIKSCVDSIKKEYKNLFGLVNCVGVAHGAGFLMTRPEDMQRVFAINYFGVLSFTQLVVRKMIKKRQGCIVNLASTAGILSDKGTLAYGASKAALIHSTKVMATELGGFGIRVNAVAPAVVESRMAGMMDEDSIKTLNDRSALQTNIYPREVVDLIIYILGDSSINITGQIFKIDRGITS